MINIREKTVVMTVCLSLCSFFSLIGFIVPAYMVSGDENQGILFTCGVQYCEVDTSKSFITAVGAIGNIFAVILEILCIIAIKTHRKPSFWKLIAGFSWVSGACNIVNVGIYLTRLSLYKTNGTFGFSFYSAFITGIGFIVLGIFISILSCKKDKEKKSNVLYLRQQNMALTDMIIPVKNRKCDFGGQRNLTIVVGSTPMDIRKYDFCGQHHMSPAVCNIADNRSRILYTIKD